MSAHHLLRLRLPLRTPTTLYRRSTSSPLRATSSFSTASTKNYAAKESQDKDSINTEHQEYSKSGGDLATAHNDDAFDSSKTTPEETDQSKDTTNVSPANPEVSKPRHPQEGGATRSQREADGNRKSSGGGSPKKNGE